MTNPKTPNSPPIPVPETMEEFREMARTAMALSLQTADSVAEVERRLDKIENPAGQISAAPNKADDFDVDEWYAEASGENKSKMLDPMEIAILEVADNDGKIAWMRVDNSYIRMNSLLRTNPKRGKKRGKPGREELQCDLILVNRTETMAVELQRKLRLDGVRRFIETDLPRFRRGFPDFAGTRAIYGAVAFSLDESDAETIEQARKMAEDAGVLLIQVEKSGLKFLNPAREKLRAVRA